MHTRTQGILCFLIVVPAGRDKGSTTTVADIGFPSTISLPIMGSAGTLSARLTPTARAENRRPGQCTAAIPI